MEINKKTCDRTKIHKKACKKCPAVIMKGNDIADSQFDDIRGLEKSFIASQIAYSCFCRPNKLCKGFCDEMNLTEENLLINKSDK